MQTDLTTTAYSTAKLPLIPGESCHRFHTNAATDSIEKPATDSRNAATPPVLVAPCATLGGFVANFTQEVVKRQLPLSVEGIRRPGSRTVRPQCGLVSLFDHHLPFLIMCMSSMPTRTAPRQTLEPEHRTRDPFYSSMVLLHNIVEIFDFTDGDSRPVLRIIALDGRFIGRTPVNGDLLRHAVAANRLRQKPLGGLLVTFLGEEKVDCLTRFIDGAIEITIGP